jgi:hypothetical protein
MSSSVNHFHDLVITLQDFAAPAKVEPLNFGSAIDKLGSDAYTFIATLAVLPFLQPIPLGVFSLIGSSAFIALGLQLFKGEQNLALPQKIRNVTISFQMRHRLASTCLKIISFCRCFTKPRLSFLVRDKLGRKIGGFIFISVGILIAIPLGGVVPFKNLFPSLAILFYCTAEIEQDGLMVIFSLICLVLTVIFYSLLIYFVWVFGETAIRHFFWN